MKRILLIFFLLLLGIAVYYGLWRWMLAGDVARVKATIDYHNAQVKTVNRATELRANSVHASGFPLHFRVRVEQPTLSYVWGDETITASLDYVELVPRDAAQGSYSVTYPATIHALYAKSGSAPEIYTATLDPMVPMLLRAQGNSQECSGFPGAARCPDAAPDAPLVSVALQLPSSITLTMQLNGASKTSSFQLTSMNVPIYQTIPADLQSPLQLFVGVLREAMVFQKNQ